MVASPFSPVLSSRIQRMSESYLQESDRSGTKVKVRPSSSPMAPSSPEHFEAIHSE